MTMRITLLQTVMGESGSLLTSGSTVTVSDAFGAAMVGSGRATDTDSALRPTSAENIAQASRNLAGSDVDTLVICNSASAVVLTIPTDAVGGFTGRATIGLYQAGAGAGSFAAGGGVTLRGTAPTISQYGTMGIVRVGANEWAYL
jgi:hypothetical protein